VTKTTAQSIRRRREANDGGGRERSHAAEAQSQMKFKKKLKRFESEAEQLRSENHLIRGELQAIQEAAAAEQGREIERLRPVEAENERLRHKLAQARRAEPALLWEDVEVPGFPAELRETLVGVIERDELSPKSKIQHCIKEIQAFYEPRTDGLSGQYEHSEQIAHAISGKFSQFLTLLAFETLDRSVTRFTVLTNDSI
jgi:hypothetical protein